MAKNIKKIAEILGAKIVARIPETGGGAFGASRLGEIVARLHAQPEEAQAPQPTNGDGPASPQTADEP